MKKLTQEFGVVRRSLKARENGVKQMHGLFLSKYTITPPSGQTNHKKAPLAPSPAQPMMHVTAGLTSRTWPRFDPILPLPSTGCISATQHNTAFCGG